MGGSEAIRPYWSHYIDGSDGLVWVIDASDRASMNDSKSELHKLLVSPSLANCPLLVCANKSDLGGMSVAEVSAELSLDTITGREWSIVGCSAVSGNGLSEGVDYITYISLIKDRIAVPTGVNPFSN